MDNSGAEGGELATWTVANTKSLTVQGEQNAGALVAKAAGRVDSGNAREFQDALETFLDRNPTALVLDLEGVTYISSAGLRVILVVARQLQSKDAKFAVCSLSLSISEVFQISGFDQIIPTYDAQSKALSDVSK